jgi:hypothetical protein
MGDVPDAVVARRARKERWCILVVVRRCQAMREGLVKVLSWNRKVVERGWACRRDAPLYLVIKRMRVSTDSRAWAMSL